MQTARFRKLIHAVLAASAAPAVLACSSDGGGDLEPTFMPERAQCIDVASAARYTALTLAPGIDGIAFASRGQSGGVGPESDAGNVTTRLAPLGTPCAGASDRVACESRVSELLADPTVAGWRVNLSTCSTGAPCSQSPDVGVITRGDNVRVATFEDIREAVAPIETRDEAAALLTLSGGRLLCNENNVREHAGGWTFVSRESSCSGYLGERFTTVTRDGRIEAAGTRTLREKTTGCVEGRRPASLAPTANASGWLGSLAACFAEIAHMEAASVCAFDELDVQLRALGAPPALVVRARAARADEVAHAACTQALAARFGGTPPTPKVGATRDPRAAGALLALALENAVEGCVREAYGALVAAHQAAHASDAGVRAAFARIALDETEHALLSFEIDAWLTTRLSAWERMIVARAVEAAWADLAVSCETEPADEVVRVAGMPTARAARALLASLRETARLAA